MKKSFILTAAAALLCITSYGQTIVEKTESASTMMTDKQIESEQTTITTTKHYKEVRTNPFWKNWEITVGAGAQRYFGDNDKYASTIDLLAPAVDLYVTKWGSPIVGFTLGFTGFQMKGLNHYYPGTDVEYGYYLTHEFYSNEGKVPPYFKQKGYFFNTFFGLQINLCNAIGGYKENRIYNCELLFGGGFALGFDKDFNHMGATFNANVINRFRVSKMVDLMINIRGNLVSDDFDGECVINEPDVNHKVNNISLDGIGGVTLGAIIKMPYDTKKKPQPKWWIPAIDEQVITDYQKTIAELEEEVRKAKAQPAPVAAPVPVPVIVEKQQPDGPFWFHINFIIDRHDLLKRERINLKAVSELIKSHPNTKYHIVGYADKQTATVPYNQALSERRTKSVTDYLVNKCGVNPDQLILDSKGGVDYMFFQNEEFSRCVMITTADPKMEKPVVEE